MSSCRIPEYQNSDMNAAKSWFSSMAKNGLLFHPDDQPENIVLTDGTPLFTKHECIIIKRYINEMFMHFEDQVYDFAADVFMKVMKIKKYKSEK